MRAFLQMSFSHYSKAIRYFWLYLIGVIKMLFSFFLIFPFQCCFLPIQLSISVKNFCALRFSLQALHENQLHISVTWFLNIFLQNWQVLWQWSWTGNDAKKQRVTTSMRTQRTREREEINIDEWSFLTVSLSGKWQQILYTMLQY